MLFFTESSLYFGNCKQLAKANELLAKANPMKPCPTSKFQN